MNKLEKRIAELERRIKELEARPSVQNHYHYQQPLYVPSPHTPMRIPEPTWIVGQTAGSSQEDFAITTTGGAITILGAQ